MPFEDVILPYPKRFQALVIIYFGEFPGYLDSFAALAAHHQKLRASVTDDEVRKFLLQVERVSAEAAFELYRDFPDVEEWQSDADELGIEVDVAHNFPIKYAGLVRDKMVRSIRFLCRKLGVKADKRRLMVEATRRGVDRFDQALRAGFNAPGHEEMTMESIVDHAGRYLMAEAN